MTDQRTDEMTADLPEGTDTVIEGAASSNDDAGTDLPATTDSAALGAAYVKAASSYRVRPANGRAAWSLKGWSARPKPSPMFRR